MRVRHDITVLFFACRYIAGRKTLAQIFAEYELQIQQTTPSGSQKQVGSEQIHMSSSQSQHASSPQAPPPSSPEPADSESKSSDDKSDKSAKQLPMKQRLKFAVRDYGSTVVVFHVAISLASLGFFYALVAR